MTVFRMAILIALLAAGSMASAQDYSIRLKYRTNVRDAPSLSGGILRTAPVGTVLSVVSEFNRWLKVNDAGASAWVAAWLDYARVDGGSLQQSTQVDNCCFVDRQCRSSDEWTSGYWAYQNNQCSAPSQPVTPDTSQPTTIASTVANNCCFVDRQCQSNADWTSGYWAFQNGQCADGARSVTSTQPVGPWESSERTSRRPVIEGSEWFVYGIGSTLDLMQRSAPEWYNFVLNAADKIVESFNEPTPTYPHANTTNWGNGATRTIGVGAGSLACYLGKLCRVSVAGILAHEAAHIHEHYLGTLIYPEFATTDPHGSPQLSARNAIASIKAGYSKSVR